MSGEPWLAASAPAGWKRVLSSAQSMERASGAGLPGPNASQGALSFPLAQFKGEAKLHVVPSNASSLREGNLPAHFAAAAGLSCNMAVLSVRNDGSVGICGRGLFLPHAALCRQPGRSTEWLLVEASRQIEKQPHAGDFSVHLLQTVLFTSCVWG